MRQKCKNTTITANTTKLRQKIKNFLSSLINGGAQVRKFNFVKIFLSSLINGGTQERIFNFVKKNIFRLYKRGKIIRRLHERKIVK